MNQKAVINGPLHGYGPTRSGRSGPTRRPRTCRPRASRATRSPTTQTKAKQLLTSHGWNVVANGVTTCQDPGTGPAQCGAGVAKGHHARVQPALRDRDQLGSRRK